MEYMDGRIEEFLDAKDDEDGGYHDGRKFDRDHDEARAGGDEEGDGGGGEDYERMSLKRMKVEFETQLPPMSVGRQDEEDGAMSRGLLRRAMLSAWAKEEATTGRTPTKSNGHPPSSTSGIGRVPPSRALTMELPTLKGLLGACWRVQRGVENDDAVASTCTTSSNTKGLDHKAVPCCYEGGPCGYVFRRGDIAWNCRTCQTDATCVLCDNCYRESDHVGHEVFFHRTTPGGCCDCGDLEAWKVDGMCGRHRPPIPEDGGEGGGPTDDGDEAAVVAGADDDFEAVRAAQRARLEHERVVDGMPSGGSSSGDAERRSLPPRLAAALAVVIGSAIQSILTASDGSAIGADVSQWRLRWADEICKLWNGVSEDEEYYGRVAAMLAARRSAEDGGSGDEGEGGLWAHPRHILDSHDEHYASELPNNYKIFLRLHNDDVHTFEEVIGALTLGSGEPTHVPVGGRGSVGEIGGAGLTGYDLKALSGDNDVMAAEARGIAERSPRNRPFAEDSKFTQQQRRAFRSSSSGGDQARILSGWNTSSSLDAQVKASALQFASDVDPSAPLVSNDTNARNLTRKVDADGQVVVEKYETINGAGIGFSRLRESTGLHCAVMTTARIESEERAKSLLEWLGSLIGSHPAVSALIVQCLVDVTEGEDVLCSERDSVKFIPGMSRGVAMWSTPRMMPCWSGTCQRWFSGKEDSSGVPAWRRRMDAFPPHLESSYLSRDESRELFRLGIQSENWDKFISMTGEFSCPSLISSFV